MPLRSQKEDRRFSGPRQKVSRKVALALHKVQGRTIVRMEPGVRARPGMVLTDARGRTVGRLSDLFGPTRRPYGILYPRSPVPPGPLFAHAAENDTGREVFHAKTGEEARYRTRA